MKTFMDITLQLQDVLVEILYFICNESAVSFSDAIIIVII